MSTQNEVSNANRVVLFATKDAAVKEGWIHFDDPDVKYPLLFNVAKDGNHVVRVFKSGTPQAPGALLLKGEGKSMPGGVGASGNPLPDLKITLGGKKQRRVYALWLYPTCYSGQLESFEMLPMQRI